MLGIPPDLGRRLHMVLTRCGPFSSNEELRRVFIDSRLYPWYSYVPSANNYAERVTACIESLYDQYDSNGENALVMFLRVLSEEKHPQDSCCNDLTKLAHDLDCELPAPEQVTIDNWVNKLEEYSRWIGVSCGTTRIFGQTHPVPLEDIYTDLYLLDRPTAYRRYDIQKIQADPGILENAERLEWRNVLQSMEWHRLFILGKPGAGKTTFLKHLALQSTRGTFDRIPIFVTLKEWVDSGITLLSFITQQFELCDIPSVDKLVLYLLKRTKKVLLLFDGLDEVRQEGNQRYNTIQALQNFSNRYPNTQVLITCRNAATEYTFDHFTYVEVADFTTEQMETFVRKWFLVEPDKGKAFLREVATEENRGLRELAHQPLLLAMLCLAFSDSLEFPQRRVEIYYDALDALLRKWDSSRNIHRDKIYRGLSIGRKHQLFARIAAQTFDEAKYFLRQDELERYITSYFCNLPKVDSTASIVDVDATAALKAIEAQHGILVERAHRVYSFAHLTFQEYYTARYVVDNSASDTLPQLLTHASEDRWREVILLTTSLLDQADAFFEVFLRDVANLVRGEEVLCNFIAWATSKASVIQDAYHSAALRCYYVYLGLVLDPELVFDRAYKRSLARLSKDKALQLKHLVPETTIGIYSAIKARELACELAETLPQAIDPNLASFFGPDLKAQDSSLLPYIPSHACNRHAVLSFNLDIALIGAYSLAVNMSRNLNLKNMLGLQAEIDSAWVYARDVSETLGKKALYEKLSRFPSDFQEYSMTDWRDFSEKLQTLIVQYRYVGQNWSFTKEQLDILNDYLKASLLLIQCLDLAYVSDRTVIKNQLVLAG